MPIVVYAVLKVVFENLEVRDKFEYQGKSNFLFSTLFYIYRFKEYLTFFYLCV